MSDCPKIKTRTGPFKDIFFPGHISVEDFDREAGAVGSALEEADRNVIYRDTLPTLHEKAGPVLVQLSGIEVGVNEKETKKAQDRENAAATKATREPKTVKAVPESFVDYAERVKATVSEEDWKVIDQQVHELALATPVDATPTQRSAGASKANLEKADDILSRDEDKREASITNLLSTVEGYNLERDAAGVPERTSLARLVGAWMAKMMQSA